MKKQITTLVEERTIEQARELAGSNRKVGALLTEIVDLLWKHRDLLETTELKDLVITAQPTHPDLEAIVRDQDETIADLVKQQARMQSELSYFRNIFEQALSSQGYKIDENRTFRLGSSLEDEQERST